MVQNVLHGMDLDLSSSFVLLCLIFPIFMYYILSRQSLPSIQLNFDWCEAPCPTPKELEKKNVIHCYNPSTGGYLGHVPNMSLDTIDNLLVSARRSQLKWKKTTFKERCFVLRTLQQCIIQYQQEICQMAMLDSGKTMVDAILGEILVTCAKIDYIVKNGARILQNEERPITMLTLHKKAYIEYHPLGTLGVIVPWNYPFHNLLNHIISGLFAGNAVVLKVSEHTSWSSVYFETMIKQVLVATGNDPNLVHIITGYGEAGQALVSSKLVDKIIFTGSTAVGKKVMAGAATVVKPVVLELGGKDPMIICDDANLANVIPLVVKSVFQNAGQNCVAPERIYVYDAIFDAFCDGITPLVKQLRQGPHPSAIPQMHDVKVMDVGAMVMPAQLDIIQELVDDAVHHGAVILCGGTKGSYGKGNFYTPTIIVQVTQEMRIVQEETFGPVVLILKVKDDNHLLEIVNDCPFGLGSSVFSSNIPRAKTIGRHLRSGMTVINDFGANYLVQSLPFGGCRASGFGRFAGPEGLKACCLQKSVLEDRFGYSSGLPGVLTYPLSKHSAIFSSSLINLMYKEGVGSKIQAVWDILQSVWGHKQQQKV